MAKKKKKKKDNIAIAGLKSADNLVRSGGKELLKGFKKGLDIK